MSAAVLRGFVLAAAVGSGLVAGTFFAFSAFVMRALGRLPAAQGIAAMRAINAAVLNPLFLGVFVGTAVLVLGLMIVVPARLPGSAWIYAGGLLYLLGTFAVTAVRNVPLNDALASPGAAEELWNLYQRDWTRWNHVRTLAAAGALAALVVGLSKLDPGR